MASCCALRPTLDVLVVSIRFLLNGSKPSTTSFLICVIMSAALGGWASHINTLQNLSKKPLLIKPNDEEVAKSLSTSITRSTLFSPSTRLRTRSKNILCGGEFNAWLMAKMRHANAAQVEVARRRVQVIRRWQEASCRFGGSVGCREGSDARWLPARKRCDERAGDFALVERSRVIHTLSWWSREPGRVARGGMVRGLTWRCAGFCDSQVSRRMACVSLHICKTVFSRFLISV